MFLYYSGGVILIFTGKKLGYLKIYNIIFYQSFAFVFVVQYSYCHNTYDWQNKLGNCCINALSIKSGSHEWNKQKHKERQNAKQRNAVKRLACDMVRHLSIDVGATQPHKRSLNKRHSKRKFLWLWLFTLWWKDFFCIFCLCLFHSCEPDLSRLVFVI